MPTDSENSNSYRVNRGGTWDYYPRRARVALRFRNAPVYRDYYLGFRLVEEAEEAEGTSSNRVRRGGCWYSVASFARVALRFHYDPSFRIDFLGFRLVEEE